MYIHVCEQAHWARSAGNSAIEHLCIIIIKILYRHHIYLTHPENIFYRHHIYLTHAENLLYRHHIHLTHEEIIFCRHHNHLTHAENILYRRHIHLTHEENILYRCYIYLTYKENMYRRHIHLTPEQNILYRRHIHLTHEEDILYRCHIHLTHHSYTSSNQISIQMTGEPECWRPMLKILSTRTVLLCITCHISLFSLHCLRQRTDLSLLQYQPDSSTHLDKQSKQHQCSNPYSHF